MDRKMHGFRGSSSNDSIRLGRIMGSDLEEPHQNKKLKKSASVKFATESIKYSPTSIDGEDLDDNTPPSPTSEFDIKNDIHNNLPSNTLCRRKRTVFSSQPTVQSLTLPRKGDSVAATLSYSLSRLRLSYPRKNKRFQCVSSDASDLSLISQDGQKSHEQIQIPESEEDKIEELLNIRNLPISMAEKKMYRNAIVTSMKTPQRASKSKNKTFSNCCSPYLKGCSKLQLWNSTLKKIEGQFGTGVVSYFVFLRWLIILNFMIFILYILFIILPFTAFSISSSRNIRIAPNTSLVTDEYLQRFPKYENVDFKKKSTTFENVTFDVDGDLLGNLGTLLDNYLPDEILDVTLRYDKKNFTGAQRKRNSNFCAERYKMEMANTTKFLSSYLQDFLQGTGWLEATMLFLGFYPASDVSYFGQPFNLPVFFLVALIVSFFLSLVLMLQFSSHGVEENILTLKSNYLTFSNILFCSWDYCIEDQKTAIIRHKSITHELKSNLSEERRRSEVKSWSSMMKMKVYMLRIFSNTLVITCLSGCFYLIYRVVNFQLEKQRQNALTDAGAYTLLIQFLPPLVITGLNIIMPIVFNNMVKFEMYDTRTQINMALFRVVFLRLLSVFVLVSTLYQQITCEPKDQCKAGLSEFCRSPICWETYVGQQLYRLVITDFLVYVLMYLAYDLPRDFIVRTCKCKVTEVIGRQVFDLPSQVLSLVYTQTLCWLGIFYSPLLPGITVLKLLIVFYIKKNAVLKHCAPAPVLYKASRSNYIFMMILMMSFFVVTVIHGYSLTSIEPSPGCSPFRQYNVMINAIPDAIYEWSPVIVRILSFLFSGFFFVPSYILLCIFIYYYWTVVVAQREMTKVLKAQIAIEGRDKQFLLNRLAGAARPTS